MLAFLKTAIYNDFLTSGHSSVVERLVATEKVEGSTPFARSTFHYDTPANAIGVYKANDLTNPELVTILPTGIGPEGLVAIPQRNLFISANEVDKEKSVTIYSLD